MEARVARLEEDMKEVKGDLRTIREIVIKIDAKLDAKADKADFAALSAKLDGKADKADVTAVTAKLGDKPGTWQVVTIALLMSGLVIAGTLGGAARLVGSVLGGSPAPQSPAAPPRS